MDKRRVLTSEHLTGTTHNNNNNNTQKKLLSHDSTVLQLRNALALLCWRQAVCSCQRLCSLRCLQRRHFLATWVLHFTRPRE